MAETSWTYDSKKGKWVEKKAAPASTKERSSFGVSSTGGIDQRTMNAILRQRRAAAQGAPSKEEIDQAEKDAYNAGANAGGAGGGKSGDPYAKLLSTLRGLGDSAAGNINTSMDDLTKTLQAQTNPFANFKAQNTSTTPALAQLLQSQGVSQDPLQQYATAINAQNTGQADAFQNQADVIRDIYAANQIGSVSDVGQQRADLMAQLQGNVLGAGTKLMGKKAPDRNAILQMILQAMKVGK
jgi:hypothetical protein